jgi:hypothetical protein
MAVLVRLAVDFENAAPEWWDGGGRSLWESVAEASDASDVVLDESLARSWLHEAATIPGWHGGPEYAPHPICLKEVDEDVPA